MAGVPAGAQAVALALCGRKCEDDRGDGDQDAQPAAGGAWRLDRVGGAGSHGADEVCQVYFGKTRDVVFDLRSLDDLEKARRQRELQKAIRDVKAEYDLTIKVEHRPYLLHPSMEEIASLDKRAWYLEKFGQEKMDEIENMVKSRAKEVGIEM